jgi:hypothetical protein
LIVAVVLVVVVCAMFAASYLASQATRTTTAPSTPTLTLTSVTMNFAGATNCWASVSLTGYGITVGNEWTVSVRFSYQQGFLQPASCTIQTVRSQTPGLTVVSANAPLVVVNGATETLQLTVRGPDYDYTGSLSLLATVSSP